MFSKNIIDEVNKGDKLDGNNYDIWHMKVHYLLNVQELFDHLTNIVAIPEAGNTIQHRRDQDTYANWFKRDRSVHFTLLSYINVESIALTYGGMTTTRLCALTLKFNQYVMDPKHTIAEHLRVMSAMIREMKAAGNDLTDEQ
ncbi:hypothetical protein ACSBR1_020535 [Camellia fascicularis]